MTHLVNVVKVLQEEDIEVKSEEPVKPVEKQEDCFTEVSGLLRKKYKIFMENSDSSLKSWITNWRNCHNSKRGGQQTDFA